MRKASKKSLERLIAAGVRLARTCVVDPSASEAEQKAARSRPQDKGYLDAKGMTVAEAKACYEEGRWCKAVLRGSHLVVVDVDAPDDDTAKEVMLALDEAGVAKAKSGKGFHYYLRRDMNADALLGGKARYAVRCNRNRKNSAVAVELLADHSTAYDIDAGQFVDFGKVRGLFSMLAFRETPAPLERADAIYESLEVRLRAFKEKDGANTAACSLLYQLAVRFKQGGLIDHYAAYYERLAEAYYKLRPTNRGVFDGRQDEFLRKVASIPETGDRSDDFCNAMVETYLADHDHHVFISAEHGKDNERQVIEWDVAEKRYVRRGFGEEADGKAHVRGLLKDMFCQMYQDRFGVEPVGKLQNAVLDEAVKLMKSDGRFGFVRNPLSQFDGEQDGASMLQSDDWAKGVAVIRIDPSKKGKARVRQVDNKPEHRLFASFGDIADRPSELWSRFLNDVLLDDETVDFFGTAVASAFVPHSKNPLFLVMNGGGRNGKSVLLKTLHAALGDYSCDVKADAFIAGANTDHKRQLDQRSMMVGKRLAVCTEGSGAPLDLNFAKTLTDGELVEVGGMFKASNFQRMRCLPIMATNVMPRLFEVSVAVRSRIKVIQFVKQYLFGTDLEPDPDLEEKLAAELPGVRRWLMDYIIRFMDAGRRVVVSSRSEQAAANYMEANRNQVDVLIEEWLEVTPDDIRPMKQGRKHGKEYDGMMAILAKAHDGSAKGLREKGVRALLSARGITRDEKGRLNCKPTDKMIAYLDEFPQNEAVLMYEGMWASKPKGMDVPDYDHGATERPNLREIPADEPLDTGLPAIDSLGSEWD